MTLRKRLKVIFAYGIDWTEYKDKGSNDHDVSTFAGKIKAEHLENLAQQIEKDILELIGEDREWDTTEPYDNPDMAQGYNEALAKLRLKLKEYCGVQE